MVNCQEEWHLQLFFLNPLQRGRGDNFFRTSRKETDKELRERGRKFPIITGQKGQQIYLQRKMPLRVVQHYGLKNEENVSSFLNHNSQKCQKIS